MRPLLLYPFHVRALPIFCGFESPASSSGKLLRCRVSCAPKRLIYCVFLPWLHDVDRVSALTDVVHRAGRNKMLQQSTSLFTVAAQQVSYLTWSYLPAALDSVDNRPEVFDDHTHTLPPAFMRSYLALRSSAGVGPFSAAGAGIARRTGGIGFPASTRFSQISRISPALRSSSF